jgi:zinc transport system substrate-binding protein
MRTFRMSTAIGLLGLLGLSVACSSKPEKGGDASFTAAVAFYPIAEIVRRVGGDVIDVIELTPPGSEPHDLELTAKEADELRLVDVVFYLGRGFQPGIQEVVDVLGDDVVKADLLTAVDLLPVTGQLDGTVGEVDGEVLDGDVDPHIWVDPANMATMATYVAQVLGDSIPQRRSVFEAAAAAYSAEMDRLGDDFAAGLARCESRTIVTSHRAFEYLARRYELTQIPIAGVSPEAEPDPKSMEAIAAAARADGVTTIFFEEQVPAALAETIAREIGAETAALNPVETITQERLDAGDSYGVIQRQNLAALVAALRCT